MLIQSSFELRGITPLMVNSPRSLNIFDPFVREHKKLASKTSKTDADQFELLRQKFILSLYIDPNTGPYLPAEAVHKAALEAARTEKMGKQIERGVIITRERFTLEYDGPRSAEEMWDRPELGFVDTRNVKLQGKSSILACRAVFPEWSVKCEFALLGDQIDERDFLRYVVAAGQIISVGTYRKRFGRFTVWQNGNEIEYSGLPTKAAAKPKKEKAA